MRKSLWKGVGMDMDMLMIRNYLRIFHGRGLRLLCLRWDSVLYVCSFGELGDSLLILMGSYWNGRQFGISDNRVIRGFRWVD